jgi:hypothetical protein
VSPLFVIIFSATKVSPFASPLSSPFCHDSFYFAINSRLWNDNLRQGSARNIF